MPDAVDDVAAELAETDHGDARAEFAVFVGERADGFSDPGCAGEACGECLGGVGRDGFRNFAV
jgi:hypothetical protein